MTSDLIGIENHGIENLISIIESLTDEIPHQTPVEFIEKHRYLTATETKHSGLMNLDLTPYWIKPLNQFDPYDPAREIIVVKGVKTAYTTDILENAAFYFMAFLRVYSGMFISADKELFGNIFRSTDEKSGQKTGKTKALLEYIGGGNLIIEGAKNADKFRQYAPLFILGDEFAAFQPMKNDGDTMRLIRDRCQAFWDMRKIGFGTTPTLKGGYPDIHFKRGNQQVYKCNCLKCGYPMELRWSHNDLNKADVKRGMKWEYKTDGTFDPNSIRYECWNCGRGHEEHDKENFINKNNAEWVATAVPVEAGIESYHVPGLVSRLNPWSKHVADWHDAYNPNGKVISVDALKVFYNNVLGSSFEVGGNKLPFRAASGHRRTFYKKGAIPNTKISESCSSHIMFLAMTVDVQKHYLSVTVWGFTSGSNPWMVDYVELVDDSEMGTQDLASHTWTEVQRMIEEQEYIADDGKVYRIAITGIDCGYQEEAGESVVLDFCDQYDSGVYPIKGDSHSSKRQKTFMEFKTGSKAIGYMLAVDIYKDRMAPALRREWRPEDGDQPRFHINLPNDTTDKEITQLTKEYKREESQKNGTAVFKWYRPKGSKNELWDLLIYAMAMLDILAFQYCTLNLGLDETDWVLFWAACEEENLFYSEGEQ
jgi:phage terminase large subunit GpA-like protein